MKIKSILCAAALCASSSIALAQQQPGASGLDLSKLTQTQIEQTQMPVALYRLAAMYKESGDFQRLAWTLKRLSELQPNSGDIKLMLATAYAVQGMKSETYDLLLKMQKQGYGFDLKDNPNFAKVADTKVWGYVLDNFNRNLKPFGEGKIAFTLPKGDTLFESLAYDPKRQQFLAGSVREGKIYHVSKEGVLEDFITPDAQNGLWSVYAMAVDADNDVLYVASTASVYFKGFSAADYGKSGVFKFSLSSGKLIEKYLLTQGKEPNTLTSIAVGKGGQVFAADALLNKIYRLDGGALKLMVENPAFTSLRGLTVSGDGKMLYFADYTMGVFGVDLTVGKPFDLIYEPDKLTLGGVDGLYWYDNNLVVIQSGMSPIRIMRLTLDTSGHRVMRGVALDAANPAFVLPTYGTIDGDGLYFIANSQKNEYDTYGTPKDAAALKPVVVFRSDLRYRWDPSAAEQYAEQVHRVLSTTKHGEGVFSNVEGGSQSVTGN
ncbi:MAG: hypothetical protein LBQ20_07810 [Rhodanobacter sp.]|jgi:hypothetical protein|nr:hypothetical protein [Rhodanobacter sp.]